MQLVDSKLYSANLLVFGAERQRNSASDAGALADTHGRTANSIISRLRGTSASQRLLALLLAASVVTASPALLATVRSAVALALQVLLEAGHAGLIAFQIFGR